MDFQRIIFFSICLTIGFSSCKKEEPNDPDPNDPFLMEFDKNYLVNITELDSSLGDWVITDNYSYDKIISVQYEGGYLNYEGESYFIQDIQPLGQESYLYVFQSVGSNGSNFMHCSIDHLNGTFSANYNSYANPTNESDYVIRSFNGTISSEEPTLSPDFNFVALSGSYALTFTNDYIDDVFDTSFIDTLDVTFSMDGFSIGETGYESNSFYSYYNYVHEENDQDSSYIFNLFNYQLTSDSIYVLDQFRIVSAGVPSVWSERIVQGTKL